MATQNHVSNFDNAIEVENVSVIYKIASGNICSLKEYIIRFFTRKLKFNKFHALSHVSFTVKKGDAVALIGENGAGKSTLLKVISGIFKPNEGYAVLSGKIVPMLELGCGFDPDLTGRENIYLNGAILGFTKEFIDEHYNQIVEFSELGDFISQPIRTYSSGMIMRLGFAIASISEPEILILDEILAVGDDKFQIKSRSKIEELINKGTTVLFVSHSIDAVRSLCNRAIWLEKGSVKMDGDVMSVTDAYINRYQETK